MLLLSPELLGQSYLLISCHAGNNVINPIFVMHIMVQSVDNQRYQTNYDIQKSVVSWFQFAHLTFTLFLL
jgi:hypothetical protein